MIFLQFKNTLKVKTESIMGGSQTPGQARAQIVDRELKTSILQRPGVPGHPAGSAQKILFLPNLALSTKLAASGVQMRTWQYVRFGECLSTVRPMDNMVFADFVGNLGDFQGLL